MSAHVRDGRLAGHESGRQSLLRRIKSARRSSQVPRDRPLQERCATPQLLRRTHASYRGPTRCTCLDERKREEKDGHTQIGVKKSDREPRASLQPPLDDAGARTKLEGRMAGAQV